MSFYSPFGKITSKAFREVLCMPKEIRDDPEPMKLTQAMALLADLAEWEVENPAVSPAPPGWKSELTSAVKVVRLYLSESRPPASRFFLAPGPLGKRRN